MAARRNISLRERGAVYDGMIVRLATRVLAAIALLGADVAVAVAWTNEWLDDMPALQFTLLLTVIGGANLYVAGRALSFVIQRGPRIVDEINNSQ